MRRRISLVAGLALLCLAGAASAGDSIGPTNRPPSGPPGTGPTRPSDPAPPINAPGGGSPPNPVVHTVQSSRLRTFSGSVVAVNTRAKEFTVRPQSGPDVNFSTYARTVFLRAGKVVPFGAIKAGDPVLVGYTTDGKKNIARTVTSRPAN